MKITIESADGSKVHVVDIDPMNLMGESELAEATRCALKSLSDLIKIQQSNGRDPDE